MGPDGVHADAQQVFGGGAHAYLGCDVRRARLELPGDVVPLGPAQVDLADHVASGEERRHGLEQFAPGPKCPGTGGPEHLVAREDVEVGADLLDVDGHVRHGLRPVDQDQGSGGMRHLGHLAHRIDGAEHVRDVGKRDELRPQSQQDLEHLELQESVVGDRHEFEVAVLLLDEDLPGHQVGVVLHLGQQDAVAAANVPSSPRVGHEIDGLGGVADEHDLVCVGGVDQPRRHRSGAFVGRRGALGELVDAAVDVRGVLGVIGVHGLDHGERLLARGGAVQVDERLAQAVDGSQDREVGADATGVEGRRLRGVTLGGAAPGSGWGG